MLTLFCRDEPVRSFAEAAASDVERYGALFRHLLAEGVYVAPSQFECLFASTAHGDQEVEATVAAARAFFEGAR
jgi:glutamate-1-semialdehyde 2,1-aminomutase